MSASITNEYGKISIDNEALAKIAGTAAAQCEGIVGMAVKSVKDGIVRLLKMESLTRGVKLHISEDRVDIEFHIIVEYGTNISKLAEKITGSVKYQLQEMAGITVNNVDIFVEGIRIAD